MRMQRVPAATALSPQLSLAGHAPHIRQRRHVYTTCDSSIHTTKQRPYTCRCNTLVKGANDSQRQYHCQPCRPATAADGWRALPRHRRNRRRRRLHRRLRQRPAALHQPGGRRTCSATARPMFASSSRPVPQRPAGAAVRRPGERLQRFAAGDRTRLRVVREFDVRRRDGAAVPVEVISTLVLDEHGAPLALVGIVRDLSARRARAGRAEALRQHAQPRIPHAAVDHRRRHPAPGSDRRQADEADAPALPQDRDRGRPPDRHARRLPVAGAHGRDRPRSASRTRSRRACCWKKARRRRARPAAQVALRSGRPAGDAALRTGRPAAGAQGLARQCAARIRRPTAPIDAGGHGARRRHRAGGARPRRRRAAGRTRPRIFDKFYRGSNAAGLPGSGLGLYMARSVVEVHGGTLELRAAAGAGGAEFRIWLPAQAAAREKSLRQASPAVIIQLTNEAGAGRMRPGTHNE